MDASKFEKKHQVMSSRVARKMSLKLLSCGRPQLNKFDDEELKGRGDGDGSDLTHNSAKLQFALLYLGTSSQSHTFYF